MSTTAMSTAGPDNAPAIPSGEFGSIHVVGAARRRPKTRRGYTLLDIRHRVINQRDEEVADFTETVCFLPKSPA
ncbi:hypothetical protein [Solimonas sp. SE-A11]|uniref:hypothetical protein n=1 Tax=Solimonas sp. SE-A11 TaxID=3054954 RepID=UPI00259CA961|nr:hypothetical protein [Solimonas sp. SE-A11]MDM4771440.1 hypothetical protein [Solimonas sp. SE-A11]